MIALTRTRTIGLLIAAASLMAVALALKAQRYAAARLDDPVASMHRVERLLAQQGWAREKTESFPEGMPLLAATFAKSGCPATTVTLLGRKAELKRYVSDLRGGDVQFNDDSRSGNDATVASSTLPTRLTRFTDRFATAVKVKPLPLIALSPAPRQPTCAVLP